MMTALQKGPLSVAFTVYSDFPTYKSGVYKKKPLDEKTAADYGVDVSPRLEVVKTSEPETRQAGEIGLVLDQQHPVGFVGQHVLAELRAERREFLGYFSEPFLFLAL